MTTSGITDAPRSASSAAHTLCPILPRGTFTVVSAGQVNHFRAGA
jgi:hypothetical protein